MAGLAGPGPDHDDRCEKAGVQPEDAGASRSAPIINTTCVAQAPAAFALIVVMMAACLGPDAAAGPPAVTLVAEDLRFAPERLEVPALIGWRLVLDNRERDIPHDVVIRDGDRTLFASGTTFGISATSFDVPALAPGEYMFGCQIHPLTMFGVVSVP